MEIKILFLVSLLSLIQFINSVPLNDHQLLSSHDPDFAANDHERFHAIPRKLMLNTKVQSFKDKDLGSYNDDLSGESHKGGGEKSSKVTMQEKSYPARVFTLDYSRVRKRRPIHNKSLPTTTTSP